MTKLIFLDTETTGLSNLHGVIQIAGFIYVGGKLMEKFSFQAAPLPNDKIDERALEVHGMGREMIESFEPASVVYKRFTEMLGKYIDKFNKNDKFWMLGYNVAFDERMLRAWFDKHGDKYFGSWFAWPSVDVAQLFALCCLKGLAEKPVKMKLIDSCRAMGLSWDEEAAHDALYDIEQTVNLHHACMGLLQFGPSFAKEMTPKEEENKE